VTKARAQWGAHWFSVPKTQTSPRPGTAPAVARSGAPICACGCGRRILPLAEQHGSPYFSRACLEKHLRIETSDAQSERSSPPNGPRDW
jgi:hypothetical protein